MSFRQFGGLQYAARNNIVSSNYNTNNNLQVTGNVGLANSYINFLSDISGNISVNGDFNLTGNLNVNGNVTATNMALTNTSFSDYNNQSVVSKSYVDAVAGGLMPQMECQCATTANLSDITGVGNGPYTATITSIDGYTLTSGTRILVNNQTTQTQNGTYTYNTGTPNYFNRASEAQVGASIYHYSYSVMYGTTNANTTYVETVNPGLIGTDIITFGIINRSSTVGLGLNL